MKITSQEEYGLRCLLHVARAGQDGSMTILEIASAEGLSVPYVAKLLSVLRHSGLIDSERGRSGAEALGCILPERLGGLGNIGTDLRGEFQ